VTKDTILINS